MLSAWLVFAFLDGLPGALSFLLMPVSILSLLLASLALMIVICVLVALWRVRQATSFAIALVFPFIFRGTINRTADCLHLALMLTYGFGVLNEEQTRSGVLIEHVPAPLIDDASFAVFDWSVGLAGSGNTFLIHDPTDEIALPQSKQKHPNQNHYGFEPECAGKSRHLLAHYYVCDTR